MNLSGDHIVSLLASARKKALIVAPFMRSEALSRLLDSVPEGVETTVVTRWRPADLLAGASDLEVYDIARSRGAALYIRHDLHAKYFAADEACLIGSANVTLTALGWRTPANLELLTRASRSADHILKFERKLFEGATHATIEQRDYLESLLDRLRKKDIAIPDTKNETWNPLPPTWIPQVRNPEELYSVYEKSSDIGRTTLKDMQGEIDRMGIIPGLNEEEFRVWVAAKITQVPLIAKIIEHINRHGPVTEDVLEELLNRIGADEKRPEAREILEVLQRWLTYFLRTHYETVQDAVKLIRARNI